jgi:protein involved in polysaccharide export with SLBB domain
MGDHAWICGFGTAFLLPVAGLRSQFLAAYMTTSTESRVGDSAATAAMKGRFRLAAFIGAITLLVGCEATVSAPPATQGAAQSDEQTIQEGDVLKVEFPGAPNLATESQEVRRDGRISLPIIGEEIVAGKTPNELGAELTKKYASQIVSSEVVVNIVSSSAAFFVSGEVLHPGKITPNRPITALEAVMEAGGFITDQADTRAVVVIRKENGHTRNYALNLQDVLDGRVNTQFYLKPFDIVYVPKKFTLF